MRILLIAPHPFFQLRGSPIAERDLLRALSGQGYDLHVLAYPHGEDPRIPGCTIHRPPRLPGVRRVPPGFSFRKVLYDALLLVQAFQLALRLRPQVLHAVEEAVFIGLLVGRATRTPVVYDMDSSLVEQMIDQYGFLRRLEGAMRVLERFAVRRSAAVVTMSQYLESLVRAYDADKLVARIEDTTLLDETNERGELLRNVVGTGDPIVLYVGNLAEYQGIDLLIDGFAEALRRGGRAELVVIGGTERTIRSYRRFANERGVDGRVHFLGRRPLSQLGWYLGQADVLASPRKTGKNTPMKIYSYMDSGTPILATRLETHTQVLSDDSACLVDPDPASMAEGLLHLLCDAPLGRRLGVTARHRARTRYGRDAFERKVVDFYESVRTMDLAS